MSIQRYDSEREHDAHGQWVKADEALDRIAELEEMVNAREIDLIHARAELARLRPLAELYPLAWEECRKHRWAEMADTEQAAHDKARAERGVQ
jgi:aldehyde:ferredoxin oxidoreductase